MQVQLDPDSDLPLKLISVDNEVLPRCLINLSELDLAHVDYTRRVDIVAQENIGSALVERAGDSRLLVDIEHVGVVRGPDHVVVLD